MEHALLVLTALLLNAVLGGPAQLYESLGLRRYSRLPALFVRAIERRLNRSHRGQQELVLRGVVLVASAVLLSLCLGWLGSLLFRHNLGFVELLILTLALPVRPTWDVAAKIHKALKAHELPLARQALAGTIWRHHALLDEYGVARAGIELLAVNFSEKILAPVFWYLLLGLPGLFISKSIYLLKETLPANEEAFSKAITPAHILIHYLPSRLAALLWLAASFFLASAKPVAAARQILVGFVPLPPQVLAVLSAAAVLDLSLGGPTSAYTKAWLGIGTARPGFAALRHGLYLFALLHLFLLILVGTVF